MIYYGKWQEFAGFKSANNTYKTIVLEGVEYIVAGIEIAADGTEWVIIVKEHIGVDGNVSKDIHDNINYYFARINLETLELPDGTVDRSNTQNITTSGKVPYTEEGLLVNISAPLTLGVTINGINFNYTHRMFTSYEIENSFHKISDVSDNTIINMFVISESDEWAWGRVITTDDGGYLYRKVLRIDNLATVGVPGADGNAYTSIMAVLEPYQYNCGGDGFVKAQSLEAIFGFNGDVYASTYTEDTVSYFIGLSDFYPVITINGNDYGFKGLIKRGVVNDLVVDDNGFFPDQSPRSAAVLTKTSPIFNYLNPTNANFVKSLPGVTISLYDTAIASGSALILWEAMRASLGGLGFRGSRPYLNDYIQFRYDDNQISSFHSKLLSNSDLNVLEWHLVEVEEDAAGIITTKKKDYYSYNITSDGSVGIGHVTELHPYVGMHPIGFNHFTSIAGPGYHDEDSTFSDIPHLDNTWWDFNWFDTSNGFTTTPYKKRIRSTDFLDIDQINTQYHVGKYNTIDTYWDNPTEGCWTGPVRDALTNVVSNTFLHANWYMSDDSYDGDPSRNAEPYLALNRILFEEELPYNVLYTTQALCVAAGYEWKDPQINYTPIENQFQKWSCGYVGDPYKPDTWSLYEYAYGENGQMGYGDWLSDWSDDDGWTEP
jgi:hypothetical protein